MDEETIVQPEMRFRPRTDLERVFDAINSNYLKETDRQILNRQLQLLDLLTYRKPSSNTLNGLLTKMNQSIEESGNTMMANNKTDTKHQNKKNEKKDIIIPPRKPWVRRIDLNTEAKGILSEYHYKTHFKAAEEIAEGKIVIQSKKDKNNFDDQTSPSFLKKKCFKSSNIYSPQGKTTLGNKDQFEISSFDDNNEFNSIMSYDNYDKNNNPIYSKRYDKIDQNQMNQLCQLAFTQPKEEGNDNQMSNRKNTVSSDNKNNYNSRKSIKQKITIVDDNNVFIDNELYNKGTQLDIIALKVLNKCNVYHNKSLHNNTSLKKKEGKLMFTNGLSISQFVKKYNLQ